MSQLINQKEGMVQRVRIGGALQNVGNTKIVRYGDPGSKWLPIEGQPFDYLRFPQLAAIHEKESWSDYNCVHSAYFALKLFVFTATAFYQSRDGVTFKGKSYWSDSIWSFIPTGVAVSANEMVVVGYRIIESLVNGSQTDQSIAFRTTDGINFTEIDLGVQALEHRVSCIAYGNSKFAIGFSDGEIRTSPTGVAWTNQTSGTTNWLRAMDFGNALFTVVGDEGTIRTSPDAVTWTSRDVEEVTTHFQSVASMTGLTLITSGSSTVLKSTNATTFTEWDTEVNDLIKVFHDTINDKLVAYGGSSIASTSDGTTVTESTCIESGGYQTACVGLEKIFLFAYSDPDTTLGVVCSSVDLDEFDTVEVESMFAIYYVNGGTTITGQYIRAEE